MGDRILGSLVIVVALAYGLSAAQTGTSFITDPVGPKLFPYLIAGTAAITGIIILLKPMPNAARPNFATLLRLLASVVVLVAYAYALKPLGFIIPTALASGLLSYQIHSETRTSILTGCGVSIVLFIIFKYMLGLGLFAWPRFLF